MNKDIDIVIVGGGAAGIAAARHLDNARCSFVLLEASSRLGGRAWTKMTAGHPLDLGCGLAAFGRSQPLDQDRRR
ncbi:FAD-dependent oxidoreductase [Rhizobium redzepovicii]